MQAAANALKRFPIVNSSLEGDTIVYKRAINIGIAVNLEWGLIVPVIKNADEKNLLGLARALNDIGERARNKKLTPDDVKDGTFTITNPGQYGGLIGTPIINQPQVAIMGMGGIKKRAVVIDDAIAIRPIIMLSLSFDHRVIDGATADQFMADVQKAKLENLGRSRRSAIDRMLRASEKTRSGSRNHARTNAKLLERCSRSSSTSPPRLFPIKLGYPDPRRSAGSHLPGLLRPEIC